MLQYLKANIEIQNKIRNCEQNAEEKIAQKNIENKLQPQNFQKIINFDSFLDSKYFNQNYLNQSLTKVRQKFNKNFNPLNILMI